MGGWFPIPKDFYRSRWKQFYKRSWRTRSAVNNPERPGPHPQPRFNPDDVPSPWKLQYSLNNFDSFVPGMNRYAQQSYALNVPRFLQPAAHCHPMEPKGSDRERGGGSGFEDEPSVQEITAQDHILRCLDPGRRGGGHSGYGRLEVNHYTNKDAPSDSTPEHIRNLMSSVAQADGREAQDFVETLMARDERRQFFAVPRLMKLCEEKEIVWEKGRLDQDRNKKREQLTENLDRGHFPYVDEQASLIDDLVLREILKLRHKTKTRRHPRWIEISYQRKRWHQQYLRRRQMLKDEMKVRMGLTVNQ